MKAPIFEEMDKTIATFFKRIDELDKKHKESMDKDLEVIKEVSKCDITI